MLRWSAKGFRCNRRMARASSVPLLVGLALTASSINRIYRAQALHQVDIFGLPSIGLAAVALVGYTLLAAAVLAATSRLPSRVAQLSLVIGALVAVALFVAGYRLLGPGYADSDEALDMLVDSLFQQVNPYRFRTFLDNTLSPMMGAGMLAVPFRILFGASAYQNPFWVVVGVVVTARALGARTALAALILVFSSVGFTADYLFGGDYYVSGIIFAVVGFAFMRAVEKGSAWRYPWGIAFGVAVTNRASTLPLLLVFAAVAVGAGVFRRALGPLMVACVTSAALWLPWWLADPAVYAPLQRSSFLGPTPVRVCMAVVFVGLLVAAACYRRGGISTVMTPTSRLAVFGLGASLALVPVLPWAVYPIYRVAPYLLMGVPLLAGRGLRQSVRGSASVGGPGDSGVTRT